MVDWQNIKIGKSTGIIQNAPDHIEIASIRTPTAHRGQGGAHAVMKHIVDYADSVNKPARLVASPLDKKTRTDKLVSFYQKYGFEPTGEKANQVGDPWMERPASNIAKADGGEVDGITAYHGSPHDFEQFDTSKIGTGEGAQAYGHGLYMAQSPSVAETYRTAGSSRNVPSPPNETSSDVLSRHAKNFRQLSVSDPSLIEGSGPVNIKRRGDMLSVMRGLLQDNKIAKSVVSLIPVDVMNMLGGKKFTPDMLLHNPSMLVDLLATDTDHSVSSNIKAVNVLAPYVAKAIAEHPLIGANSGRVSEEGGSASGTSEAGFHDPSKITEPSKKGNMYEVHINAHPHHMLDWDKPMHQQSPYVQNILQLKDVEREAQEEAAHHFKQYGNIQNMPPHIVERINHLGDVVMSAKPFPKRGSEFYLSLQHDLGGAEEATKHLQNRGIKGIRYLDAGSRNTDNKPTYNYVVFNDKDVHIKRKYEQGGRVGFADGGDIWDDSRVRRTGEGGQESALDFIQNAPLYKQRMEPQAQPQSAPAAAPSTEGKPMPVTVAPPPAIVQPAQPVQQKQEQPQGQVGLYAVGTNDPNPDMTVQSAQRIIETSRAMGINPVFLLPNQAGNTQYAQNSRALQKYLDDNGIQYQMPQYGDKDPLHMTPNWAAGAAKSYSSPFIAGDSNSVRLGIVGYGAKGDGKTIVHPESGAVLGRVGASSKAIADELERHLRWQQQNRTQRNSGGRVHYDVGGFVDPRLTSLSGVQSIYTEELPMPGNTVGGVGVSPTPLSLVGTSTSGGTSNAPITGEPFHPEGGSGGGAESGDPGGSQGSAGGGQPGGGGDGMGSFSYGGRAYYNTGGPVNVSKAQDTAGNFKKEHEKIHGIPVAIEVKKGKDRVKYKTDGSVKFKAKQYADYGAILGTKDADGMDTDVMVGPHKDSEKAYIIDQRKHDTGKFDEHKVMLGFNKRKKAIKAYTKSYADRHGKDRVQDVVKTDITGLKKWLKHGDLKKAAAKDALINRALEVVSKKT